MGELIRTIGLYQPYASLMLYGKLESRWVVAGKKPPFPKGKYLIYSTKKSYTVENFRHVSGDFFKDARAIITRDNTVGLEGFALCVAELTDVFKMNRYDHLRRAFYMPSIAHMRGDLDHFEIDGRVLWGLHFENVQAIEPFPFKGKQGVGFLSQEDYKLIKVKRVAS